MAKARQTKQVVQRRVADHEHASCKALGQVLDRVGDKWTSWWSAAVQRADAL
jgi:hypothetical protein